MPAARAARGELEREEERLAEGGIARRDERVVAALGLALVALALLRLDVRDLLERGEPPCAAA